MRTAAGSGTDGIDPVEEQAFEFLDQVRRDIKGTATFTPVLNSFRAAFQMLDERMARLLVLKWFETYPARHPEENLNEFL